jgi:hypothetical protein
MGRGRDDDDFFSRFDLSTNKTLKRHHDRNAGRILGELSKTSTLPVTVRQVGRLRLSCSFANSLKPERIVV